MTQETIDQINKSIQDADEWDQGIFREPQNIPSHIKEPVVYMRQRTGGYSGGGCWDDSDPQYCAERGPKKEFVALEKTLEVLCPNLSFKVYKEVSKLVQTDEKTEWEYYGNSDDYEVSYVLVSELEKMLANL
jgi:hypothetical protein